MVQYKVIPNFPGYRVGDDGTIWTQIKWKGKGKGNGKGIVSYLSGEWRRKTPGNVSNGYQQVRLYSKGVCRTFLLHRLVLELFVGPCPVGMEACHFPDPSPKNNRLENLRWDTRKENAADVGRQGNRPKGSRHYAAKLTRYRAKAILALAKKKTLSQREIAELFGVSQGTVWQIFRKNRWEVANVNV